MPPSGHLEHLPARAVGAHTFDHHLPWIGELGEHPLHLSPLGPIPPGRTRTGELRERYSRKGVDAHVSVGQHGDAGALSGRRRLGRLGGRGRGRGHLGGGGRRGGLDRFGGRRASGQGQGGDRQDGGDKQLLHEVLRSDGVAYEDVYTIAQNFKKVNRLC